MAGQTITPGEFENWLAKRLSKRGEALLPSTIERYVSQCKPLFSLDKKFFDDKERLRVLIQKTIDKSRNHVFYSSVRHWLEWIGWDERLVKRIRPPKTRANARTSKRFLQSKVLSKGEIKRLFNEEIGRAHV